ncbi:Methyltransferase domain [Phytophthora infestans]|uniref:Methyltransferase domain n=1 Tax=Phytophthora infestans TaxID=4787 RepID=A0A8S9U3Q5_PHYIN|nr:Methyltransferase domain [Phytophthora infestans]
MANVSGSVVAPSLAPTQLEHEHVHKVYDLIAPHFSHTRHHPWPQVTEFLDKLEPDALVADVGCGNGKYLNVNPSLCMIGVDRSIPLMHAGAPSASNLLGCDALKVPLRTGAFDAALSIAVLHHISTEERRVALISELARMVRIGGEVLIVAWAFEQDERSKRRFEKQDVMVEWKLQQKYAKEEEKEDSASGSHGKVDREKRWVVYERYCHVYRSGELEALVAQARSYEQLQSPNMAHFWWKKWNMLPSNDRGDPTKPDARCWDAMADRLFDAELYVFAADFYAQALAADVEKQIEPSNRFRYRYLLSLLAFVGPQGPTVHLDLCRSVAWTLSQWFRRGDGNDAGIRDCFGDPNFYRLRAVYFTSFPAMYRVVFAWVDGPAGRIARCWRHHWAMLHPPPKPVSPDSDSGTRAKLKEQKKKPKPHLTSPARQSRIPTRTAFRGKVSALSSTSQSPTKKPRTSDRNLQNVKRTKPARRTGSSNNASSAEENQQFQGDQKVSLIEERCENVKLTASAKKSSEFDELSPMKRRTSFVKRLRVKRAERPASAGVEKISSDEEQTMTQSSSTSLLDIYPLNLPRADNFIATCGREPGFADLDLNEVGEFARLAHYRARVLTGKHAAVNNLDTTEVKPQWLQDVERAVAFVKTHRQRNLVSGKVVVEGDSAAHLSEVHTRLVLMITNLCRQYTRDHGETSFTRRLRVVARKLIEWKFARISEVIAALNDAKTVATLEEKQRNLEFYHVHRS